MAGILNVLVAILIPMSLSYVIHWYQRPDNSGHALSAPKPHKSDERKVDEVEKCISMDEYDEENPSSKEEPADEHKKDGSSSEYVDEYDGHSQSPEELVHSSLPQPQPESPTPTQEHPSESSKKIAPSPAMSPKGKRHRALRHTFPPHHPIPFDISSPPSSPTGQLTQPAFAASSSAIATSLPTSLPKLLPNFSNASNTSQHSVARNAEGERGKEQNIEIPTFEPIDVPIEVDDSLLRVEKLSLLKKMMRRMRSNFQALRRKNPKTSTESGGDRCSEEAGETHMLPRDRVRITVRPVTDTDSVCG